MSRAVARHYTHGDLMKAVLRGLKEAGLDADKLTPEDTVPLDHLHGRGERATEEILESLGLKPGDQLLDIGSGLGGPARMIAKRAGARVSGVDVTPEFVEAAVELSELTGMAGKTDFRVANALDLPFADGSFDAAYTHNVAMSVADKKTFYAEARRIVRSGGRFVAADVAQGPGGPPFFPVPWAETPDISHLLEPGETETLLREVGFAVEDVIDETEKVITFDQETRARIAEDGPPVLSPMIVLGKNARERLRNSMKSVIEKRTIPVVFVCRKP